MSQSKLYQHKYRKEWEANTAFKGWLKPFIGDDTRAYCHYCKVDFCAINYVFLKTRLIPCKLCHVQGLISSLISLPWMVMKLGLIMFYNGYAMEKINGIFTSGYANYAMTSSS